MMMSYVVVLLQIQVDLLISLDLLLFCVDWFFAGVVDSGLGMLRLDGLNSGVFVIVDPSATLLE
jgi:hypothetical protein